VKNIVAENQRRALAPDEAGADDESLRNALGCWLHRVREADSPFRAVTKQLREARRVLRVEITRMSRMPASISVDSG